MNGRDRLLAAIARQRPDRLPCQVHSWMGSWLDDHLPGQDQFAAYARFGMDPVIYLNPDFRYAPADLANWQERRIDTGTDASGNSTWRTEITTPDGTLTSTGAANRFTGWDLKHLITDERDFELWARHQPVPISADWGPVIRARQRIGAHGIVRGWHHAFGQGSPWQDLCHLMGTQPAIMAAQDRPDWIHACLRAICDKKVRAIEACGRIELDLIECGGGAGSNTVISPRMFREFCLPYDREQIAAIHDHGSKVVYHLCGGLMHMLELVCQTGADGLETMTPKEMGGDCDLAAAYRQVHDRLFLVGGFDQQRGFERSGPQQTRTLVESCHAACPDGGYICSPSDHFFAGGPEVLQAFADAARACSYEAAMTAG